MATKYKVNYELKGDSNVPVTRTECIKHGSSMLNVVVDNKANATDVTSGLATKADSTTVSALSSKVSTNETNIATQTARIDNIATLPSGSTSGDAELMDIRVGSDGNTYTSAGASVRTQISDLKSEISNLDSELSKLIDTSNLINKDRITKGAIVYQVSNGKPDTSFNEYFYSDFIEVTPKIVYEYWKGGYFLNIYSDANFDSYIGTLTTDEQNRYFAPNESMHYVVISAGQGAIDNIFFRTADVNTQNDVKISRINSEFTKHTATKGQIVYSASNGQPSSSFPDYFYSDFIRVDSNVPYEYYKGGWFINCYSDANFSSYISTYASEEGSTFVPPSGTKYVVISGGTYTIDQMYFRPSITPFTFANNQIAVLSGIVEIGPGKQFTTMKDGIAYAITAPNARVIVYPGTYDLVQEFGSAITNHTANGIPLGSGVTVEFMAGAYVTANFDNSDRWIYDNFQPFYSIGDYTLIGANITASNCRYCVHDEHSGTGTYHHVYKDCIMKYTNTHSDFNYVQCIGGGLGEHGFIEIDGGIYESYTSVGAGGYTPEQLQIPISYHNGINSTCDGKIFINNVYLKNKGHFKFGMYGTSTIKTPIVVSNCSMGSSIDLMYETTSYQTENFELVEWNNKVRN